MKLAVIWGYAQLNGERNSPSLAFNRFANLEAVHGFTSLIVFHVVPEDRYQLYLDTVLE